MTDANTKEELLTAAADLVREAQRIHYTRDAVIRRAASMATLREVAVATGLSVARIHQIVKGH